MKWKYYEYVSKKVFKIAVGRNNQEEVRKNKTPFRFI